MKLIVGLGNPGEKYEDTRHNLGFRVVDVLARQFIVDGLWLIEKKFKSEILEINELSTNNYKLLLAKPQTYMNNSGMSVRLIADFYKISLEDIIIIHDDLDLILGKIKIRVGGASAGHHGVESVIKYLNDDKFVRVKIGIGSQDSFEGEHKRKNFNAEKFVVSIFDDSEKTKLKKIIKDALKAVETILEKGVEKAQNSYN